MIVSFIETTDLTPKQYPNRINLTYLFPNKPTNPIPGTVHAVQYRVGPGPAPLAITGYMLFFHHNINYLMLWVVHSQYIKSAIINYQTFAHAILYNIPILNPILHMPEQ